MTVMAGWSMTVCLPGHARDWVRAAVAEAMAPFDRMGEAEGELGLWEGCSIRGGIQAGEGFRVKPGRETDPRLVREGPWPDGVPVTPLPGMCAGGPRELLALEETRAAGEELAGRAWDLWHDLARRHPSAEPCGDGRCCCREGHHAYAAQDLPKAFLAGKRALLDAHRGPRVGGVPVVEPPGRGALPARPRGVRTPRVRSLSLIHI